ncbi:MAG: hypothetical protein GY706_10145 [Bacteroides sp.]|nr:hypothetical protein [Bacteroides sp.]
MPLPLKVYKRGRFGEKVQDWIIPVVPQQTAKNRALARSEQSHWDRYTKRLETLNKQATQVIQLHGELLRQLQAIGG